VDVGKRMPAIIRTAPIVKGSFAVITLFFTSAGLTN
jgi:hypothetical protein